MQGNISGEAGYINRVAENVLGVSRKDFGNLYDDLREADCIILAAEGRSYDALNIGLYRIDREIKIIEDVDFPGRNIEEAASTLEEKYEKINLLVNTGSGETETPKYIANQLSAYIEEKGSEKFTIDVITSNSGSSVGRIGRRYGHVVQLEGRARKPNMASEYARYGVMGDIFELGSLSIIHAMKKALNENEESEMVFEFLKQELPIIGEVVDEYIPSVQFKSLVDKMENRCNITVGGKGPSRYVADMTAIRLQHVKRVSGSDAYVAGPFAHPPWPGDIGIFISWSGETKPTLSWCDKYRRSGGYIFSITGNRKNRLSEKSDDSFVISSESPSFYERTAFALSPVPLHLLEIFERRGFNIPEYLLEWYHSIT